MKIQRKTIWLLLFSLLLAALSGCGLMQPEETADPHAGMIEVNTGGGSGWVYPWDGAAVSDLTEDQFSVGEDGTVIDKSDSGEASVRRRLYAVVMSTGTRGRIMKGTGSSWHNEYDPMWIGTDGALWKEADYIHYNAVNPEWTPDGMECGGYRLEIRYAARSNSSWTDFTELDGINYAIAGDTLVWNNSTGFSEIPLTDGVAGYELETADNRTALLLHKDGRYLLVNAGTGEVKIFQ
jgi:hypothetical protein